MQCLVRVTALLLLSLSAHAGDWQTQQKFPGIDADEGVMRAVKQAEAAYEEGDFKRALWLYEKRLVSVGDKFAQYTVGYMHAMGEGTARDPEVAAAWFLLAAERGHPQLVANSQQALKALSPEARDRARQQAEKLRDEYGDQQLLTRLLRAAKQKMREQTGSRSGTCNQPGRITLTGDEAKAQTISVKHFCEVMKARIEEREAYLEQYTVHGDLAASSG